MGTDTETLRVSKPDEPKLPRPARGRWWMKLFAVVTGLSLTVVVAELGLRVAGIGFPNLYQPDELLGTSLIPGAEGWMRTEGEAYVTINSRGFRDREHAIKKPEGTIRIAVLGDSYTEASQVAMEDTYWSVLERSLGSRWAERGKRVEVLNFSCGGYGPAQEYLLLRHRVWEYDPDIVLLGFCLGNDVSDCHRSLKKVANIPYFTLDGEELVLDDSFRTSEAFRRRTGFVSRTVLAVLPYSRLLQVANRVRYQMRVARRRVESGDETDPLVEIGQSAAIYKSPESRVWGEAWAVADRLLCQMSRECRARGVTFSVVTLSTSIQVHPDKALRARLRKACDVDDLFYTDRRVAEIGAREGFGVLNLAEKLRGRVDASGEYLHGFARKPGFGHWNERGHALAGELIAEWLATTIDFGAGGQ